MNIDRNNYEMYFLLYVDNELSAEQRNAVEKFVAQNIDLKPELELLMQTALPAEDVVFTAKDILYKNELTAGSLQEQMLLQLDDELDPLLLNSLSAEIASNDDLKRAWNILQQTKLDPDEKIVFKDKKSLYRHEKDNIVSIYFRRVAAAILIIGLALFIGLSKFSATITTKDVAGTNSNKQPSKKIIQPGHPRNSPQENEINNQQPPENIAAVKEGTNSNEPAKENSQDQPGKDLVSASQKNINVSPSTNENNSKQKKDDNNVVTIEKKNAGKEIVQKENNNLPKPYFENINKEDRNKTVSSSVQDNMKALQNKDKQEPVEEKVIAKADIKEPGKIIEDRELTATDNGYAKNAVADEANSETNNNSILFISEEKVNRSKFNGLFKKVKRVLTRNANIQTGKNVKIAGFEIATR